MAASYSTTIEIQELPLWEKLKARRALSSFDLEVTARCPNNCRHCYINLPASDRAAMERELTLAEIDRISSEAVELGAMWCLITGGEPLLRPDFADLYMLLKRKGLLVSVFTTATLINEKHIALFQKYPPRDIEVTVYGVTRETYESVTRRPGSFAAFRRGLDVLLKSGVKVRLKAMALRSNVQEMETIARFCRERTKDYFRFDPMLHLRYDGDPVRNAEIRSERLSPVEIVALERADSERFGKMQEHCDTLIDPEFSEIGCNHLFHCGAGTSSFNVGYDGTFRLCSSLNALGTTCDLRERSVKDAWENLAPKVRDMRSERKEFLEGCRRCPLINLCLWCPAHAYLETGEMDAAVPYFCEVAHARAEMLQSVSH
ncbi:MAG: radical SAM protein [Chloroflexi bacterium]|nr:radical SAM protein [Chloroflexota bacterium]